MWDYEADVVVAGYGGAGGAAALAAVEAGARVLMVEKNPAGGGNTQYSGGTIRTYLDIDKAIDHIEALCEGATERDVVEAFVKESARNPEWITQIGGEVIQRKRAKEKFPYSHALAAYPSIRGAEGMGPRMRVKGGTGDAAGIDLWGVLSRKVAASGIEILYSSPVKRLLMEKGAGLTGLVATRGDHDVKVGARRGIVLACGGFEYDQAMQRHYLGQSYFGMCNPANTGDGIRLAGDIGADMWHMNAAPTAFGYKFPEFVFGIKSAMPYPGFIYVDQLGKRFMDEPGTDSHFMWAPTSYIDAKTLERKRIPSYLIFDEDTRTKGAIASTEHGKVSDVYQWSSDNSAEIKKGWIKAAENIADLAPKINIRPDLLQTTIAQYNLQCVGGYDPEHGRAADTLVPLGRPPYYAIEMWPCLFNTQGGPKRNAKAQVLDVWGNPIKRLYSAGELGSLWHRNYPGAGNVSEALASGRIAGRNAAAEEPLGRKGL